VLNSITPLEKAEICCSQILTAEMEQVELCSSDFKDFFESFDQSLSLVSNHQALFLYLKTQLKFAEKSKKTTAVSLTHLENAYTAYSMVPEYFWGITESLTFNLLIDYAKLLFHSQTIDTNLLQKIISQIEDRKSSKLEELQVLSVKLNLLHYQSNYGMFH